MYNPLEKFKEIDTVICDVDGVLTNNQVLTTEEGELLRSFNVKDGYAIKKAIEAGIRFFAITGGRSQGVKIRLDQLGFTEVHLGISNKLLTYEKLVEQYRLDEGRIMYLGDDVPDYKVMRRVGLPACPKDAAHEVLDIALYISPLRGGAGFARDVIEKLLRIQEKWPQM